MFRYLMEIDSDKVLSLIKGYFLKKRQNTSTESSKLPRNEEKCYKIIFINN